MNWKRAFSKYWPKAHTLDTRESSRIVPDLASFFPSPWIGSFSSRAEFLSSAEHLERAFGAFDEIDDRLLVSRHPFVRSAYCAMCREITPMRFDWRYGSMSEDGSVAPAWTETGVCQRCGLNSRMRALVHLVRNIDSIQELQVYIAEEMTPAYDCLKGLIPGLTGSEYLGAELASGDTSHRGGRLIRHEDLTDLSFADASFDVVITQDVFEHVPAYESAFREIRRVLKRRGSLLFTVPFFPHAEMTQVRASVGPDGVVHHLPPEMHGDPVSSDGALCFQNFGWDLLDTLRSCGFVSVNARLYWGPWLGHIGGPFFVFEACAD